MKPPIPTELRAETLAFAIRFGIASNDPLEAVRWIKEYARQQTKKTLVKAKETTERMNQEERNQYFDITLNELK